MKRFLLPALWVLVVVGCILHARGYGSAVIDDAYITFTYSKHLAEGFGPVFSVGHHVEATSSMLWAVLMVPFERIGIGAAPASKVIGLGCYVASALVAGRLAELLAKRTGLAAPRAVGLLAGAAVALSSPLALWSFYGMENGLVALLLVLALERLVVESHDRQGDRSAWLVAALVLARPEGLAFVALFALARLVAFWLEGQSRRWLGRWFLVLGAVTVPYKLWERLYYGHWMPNTVLAKITGTWSTRLQSGQRWLMHPYDRLWAVALLVAFMVPLLALLRPRGGFLARMRELWPAQLAGTLALTQLVFALTTGGDWMPNGRFLSHLTPVAAAIMVLPFAWIASLGPPKWRAWPPAVGLVALAALVPFGRYNWERTITARGFVVRMQDAEARALDGMAAYLNEHASADDTVACSDIGRVAYHFKGHVLDWWGLADPLIAEAGQALGHVEPPMVLDRHPRYIVLYSTTEVLGASSIQRDMGVYTRPFWASPDFRHNYHQVYSTFFWRERYHVLFERNEPD